MDVQFENPEICRCAPEPSRRPNYVWTLGEVGRYTLFAYGMLKQAHVREVVGKDVMAPGIICNRNCERRKPQPTALAQNSTWPHSDILWVRDLQPRCGELLQGPDKVVEQVGRLATTE